MTPASSPAARSLLAMLNLRVVEPAMLVDITRIPELDAIREIDG